MKAFLFVTDLDDTLVGDKKSLNFLEQLNEELINHRKTYGSKIVYATGRSLTLYQQLIKTQKLLEPDALITAVGTEIYFNSNYKTPDLKWSSKLSIGWNRDLVEKIAANFEDLVLQQASEQLPFKVSYLVKEEAAKKVIPQLDNLLKKENIKFNLIYSGNFSGSENLESKNLDILPFDTDKGLAMKYLQNEWGHSAYETVVCGDSGNDIALFSRGEERGIIVGNALSELREWYTANKTDYRYLAKSFYAEGILEGLRHFKFI
ncbi:sucrose-phosphate phosphatase [Anabaena sp. WFMT]|uniref:sucrose-phosphate phosphatase n=1 Tax=Anabaena sp. WFMT TaxID=3449730 RepID=UPI003F22C328